MKKPLPLLTLSSLLLVVGCESRVDKLKVACSNISASYISSAEMEPYANQVLSLASPPKGKDDNPYNDASRAIIFCSNLQKY